jgi:hypothetical protein
MVMGPFFSFSLSLFLYFSNIAVLVVWASLYLLCAVVVVVVVVVGKK